MSHGGRDDGHGAAHGPGHGGYVGGHSDHIQGVHAEFTGGHAEPGHGNHHFTHAQGAYGGYAFYEGLNDGAQPRIFNGVFTSEDCVVIEVAFHNYCDIRDKYIELAKAAGLVSLEHVWANLTPTDQRFEKIVARNTLDDPRDTTMPSGLLLAAGGWSRVWREFWQIGKRKNPLFFWEPLTVWGPSRAFLEVSCVTWCFSGVGDFQTVLVLKIKYLHHWNNASQRWTTDQNSQDQHKAKARVLADQLHEFILRHPALDVSCQFREECLAILKQRAAAVPGAR